MTISDIYAQYHIPPLLQLHQLRAASVGKLIVDNWTKPLLIYKKAVVEELLLHDMGNIIKFDLDNSPLGKELEDINYWKGVQRDFIEKYGKDEHDATRKIGEELGVSKDVMNLLSQLKSTEDAAQSKDYNIKICFYGDLRCGPFGILSVDKRFDDLLQRYKGRNHPIADVTRTEKNREHTHEIEKQLQEFVGFDLTSITDAMVAGEIEKLKNYKMF